MAIIKNPLTLVSENGLHPNAGEVLFIDNITDIPINAFYENGAIKSITIPNTVLGIGEYAFWNCYNLESVVLPDTIEEIEDYAFQECYLLTSMTILATTPPILGRCVFEYADDCIFYVPAAALNDYRSSWSEYASRIQAIPD